MAKELLKLKLATVEKTAQYLVWPKNYSNSSWQLSKNSPVPSLAKELLKLTLAADEKQPNT